MIPQSHILNAFGGRFVTAQGLIDLALGCGAVDSVRYVVRRDHNPTVSAIVTVGGREIDETVSWSDIETGYKPDVAETLADKIELLKKRSTVRIIRDVCPDILNKLN